jgi:hypothetical protein
MTTTTTTLTLSCEVCRRPCEVRRKPNSGRRDFICLDHGDDAWHIFHYGCAPNLDASVFWFPTYLVADPLDLLDRTASMLRSGWLGATDWGDFIHRIVRANQNAEIASQGLAKPSESATEAQPETGEGP